MKANDLMKNFFLLISYCMSVFVIAAYILNMRAERALVSADFPGRSKKDDNIDSQKGN